VRIAFFGSGAFGLPTLRALDEMHELVAIISQPDRPAGRKRVLTPTPIAQWSLEHRPDGPLLRPENINEPAELELVRSIECDAWVVIAYGQKLSEPLLEDRFAINLHASLLPRWRGAAPINHAILAGDSVTGNSVIALASRMDAGVVYGQSEREIAPTQTAGELHDALAEDGPALVLRVLEDFAAGSLDAAEQLEDAVSIAPKLAKSDGWIRLSDGADACRQRVNGLSPWPAVTIEVRGEPLKVLCAKSFTAQSQEDSWALGALFETEQGLAIGCGSAGAPSALVPLRVQAPGKKEIQWNEYARGKHLSAGDPVVCQAEAPSC